MWEKISLVLKLGDRIVKCFTKEGFNDINYAIAYGKENFYLMLHQKYITIEKYKNSTQKDEYQCLYKKDDELKGDNITDEAEGIVEYGNDFINCKLLCNGNKKGHNLLKIIVKKNRKRLDTLKNYDETKKYILLFFQPVSCYFLLIFPILQIRGLLYCRI